MFNKKNDVFYPATTNENTHNHYMVSSKRPVVYVKVNFSLVRVGLGTRVMFRYEKERAPRGPWGFLELGLGIFNFFKLNLTLT